MSGIGMDDMSTNDQRADAMRNSQLSAMFDNELPDTECELLARRVSRDVELQRQWASYALIGAALRGEPVRARSSAGVVRDGRGHVAERVKIAIHGSDARAKLAPGDAAKVRRTANGSWLRPLAGVGIAAGVAAVSVLWLQQQAGVTAAANTTSRAATTIVLPGSSAPRSVAAQSLASARPEVRGSEPISYTVPTVRSGAASIASAQLANYVVAHSEFSGPLARRNLLSALVSSDAVALPLPTTEPVVDPAAAASKSLAPDTALPPRAKANKTMAPYAH